jgi:hypothetical protein
VPACPLLGAIIAPQIGRNLRFRGEPSPVSPIAFMAWQETPITQARPPSHLSEFVSQYISRACVSVVGAVVLHVILSTASCAFSMTRDTSTISLFTSFSAASSLVHCACIDVPHSPRAQHEGLRGGISKPKSKQSLKRVASSRSTTRWARVRQHFL